MEEPDLKKVKAKIEQFENRLGQGKPLKKNHIRQLYAVGTTLAIDGSGDAVFFLFRLVEIRDRSLVLRVQKDGIYPRKQQTAG